MSPLHLPHETNFSAEHWTASLDKATGIILHAGRTCILPSGKQVRFASRQDKQYSKSYGSSWTAGASLLRLGPVCRCTRFRLLTIGLAHTLHYNQTVANASQQVHTFHECTTALFAELCLPVSPQPSPANGSALDLGRYAKLPLS